MGKANPIYTNFSAGEWSPRMEGRIELDKYYASCRKLENMLVVSQGGADFRPGTKFVINGKTNGLPVRLIPFSIKGVGEYILEIGNQYMYVIKCSTHAQLEAAGVPLKTDVATPWLTAELFEIKYAQTKDAIYLVHPSHKPRKLVRTNDTTDWTLTTPTFSGWLKSTEKDIISATQADPVVVGSTAHGFENGDIVYITDVLGMTELNTNVYKVANKNANDFQLASINGTTFTAYISGGKVKKAGNIFGTASNYPAAIAFYQQRMVLAGTTNYPDKVWLSKVGDFLDFKMPTGLEFTIAHNKGMVIRWLAGKSEIAFGADSCEGVISGAPISGTNYDIRVESGYGSKNIQGQLVNERILFVQDGGKRIREFAYHEEAAGWLSPDLTIFADHITGDGIVEVAVQRNPDTILWCVRSDGALALLTYEYKYGIAGWSRMILAETSAEGEEAAVVESIAIVRGTSEDEIYISVKRTVNEVTKRFIEYFVPRDFGSAQKNAYFVDCGITWDGGAVKTITAITQADPPVVSSAGHLLSDGDLVKITDVVDSDEGIIDLQDFAEIDEGDAITLAVNTATVVGMARDDDELAYRSLGHEFLDGTFTYTFQFNRTAPFPTAGQSMVGTWGVADVDNYLKDIIDDENNALTFIARRAAGGDHKFQMWEIYGGDSEVVTFDLVMASPFDYYVKVERTITGGANDCGEFTVSIYSDAGMATLLETQTIDLHTIVKYEYIYVVQNYHDALTAAVSYTLTDLSGPANRGSYNHKVFKVDSAGANDFELDDEDDNDINGYHYKQYVSGGKAQKVIQTVPGLTHLVGESVAVLVDGSTHSEETVAVGGTITLDRYGNVIHAGLGYVPWLKPARPEAGGSRGVAQGKKQRIHKLMLRVYNSLNCLVGPNTNHMRRVLFREDDDAMGSPPALFSGDKEVAFLGSWDRKGDILITTDTPTPLNILAIMPEMVTND